MAPAAVFIYPFIARVIDMINEVYGVAMTHVAIMIAVGTQILMVIFFVMINSLTPVPFFPYEEAWQVIFSMSIRITTASWFAFLICSNMAEYVFDTIKKRFLVREMAFCRGTMVNPGVWLRSSVSDAVSISLDSLIGVVIAFARVMPLMPLLIGQIVMKNIIGFIDNLGLSGTNPC